nr:hypothetical protein [Jannaschia sp. S6380]
MIGGLCAGLLLPDLAEMLRPWVGHLVGLLLFVTAIRVGAGRALGALDRLAPSIGRVVVLQIVAPLMAVAIFALAGVSQWPLALAISLMLAAPSLTGAPNFAIMVGRDPSPGMQLLVLGTALFPVTAMPVLLILDPAGQGAVGALQLAAGLMGAILLAVGLGFAARRLLPRLGAPDAQAALDGAAALLLAVVVVGLMSAIGPLLRSDPLRLAGWLAVAFAVNLLLVAGAMAVCRRARLRAPVATAIYAGNRNIALFLIVLPPEVAAPLMIFVGCYQVPMYLTPVLIQHLDRHMDA